MRLHPRFQEAVATFTGGGFLGTIDVDHSLIHTTWNAFLNPDGYRDYLFLSKHASSAFAECLFKTPISISILQEIRKKAEHFLIDPRVNLQLKLIFENTFIFLKNYIDIPSHNRGLKLWDVGTTFLLLRYPIGQTYRRVPLLISWTGYTQWMDTAPFYKVYTDMSTDRFYHQFVQTFFVKQK